MMNNGSVTIDLRARIMGYEASLRDLQDAMKKVDLGSDIGKKLARAISQAETQLKSLSKNLMPRVSSDTQVDVIVEKVNSLGDSIQTVAGLMQQIGTVDLNFDAFGDEINKIQQQIATLSSELEGKLSAGLQSAIAQSSDLKNVFENIVKVDTKDKGPAELFEALAKGAEDAATEVNKAKEAVDKATEDYQKAQDALSAQKIKAGPNLRTGKESGRVDKQLETYKKQLKGFEELKSNIEKKLGSVLKDKEVKDVNKDSLLNSLFNELTPANFRVKLNEFYESLKNAGLYSKRADFYKVFFGEGITQSSQLQKILNLPDPGTIVDQLRIYLDQIKGYLKQGDYNLLANLIDSGNLKDATSRLQTKVRDIAKTVQNAIGEAEKEVNEKAARKTEAESRLNVAQSNQIAIQDADASLRAELTNLQNENAQLRQRIEALEQQAQGQLNTGAEAIRGQGARAGIGAQQWKLGEDAALKYKEAVEQVRSREQLVGRVQGVVQQWFSIYTVVNMVGNAVRSIISTIQELDKTITEIAIVTDMTQSDLWGQMDSYTEMARSYAASISGVYQVSQLFYQQGSANI